MFLFNFRFSTESGRSPSSAWPSSRPVRCCPTPAACWPATFQPRPCFTSSSFRTTTRSSSSSRTPSERSWPSSPCSCSWGWNALVTEILSIYWFWNFFRFYYLFICNVIVATISEMLFIIESVNNIDGF